MNLSNEAAYLYILSKELLTINKRMKKYSRKAEKHLKKHSNASSEEKKKKHHRKHQQAKDKLEFLIQEHNKRIKQLRHHHTAFAYALHKEHALK